MLKVAQIIDSLIVGGAEKLQVTFAEEALGRDDIESTIICLRDMQPSFREELEAMGARIIFFESRKVYGPRRFWRLWQFIRKEKFDVIHAHLSAASILSPPIGFLTGTPVITTIHNVKESRLKGSNARERVEDWMLTNGAKEVIGVGQAVADANKERLNGRTMRVVHNAVPTMPSFSAEEDKVLRQELMGSPDNILILTVGRLLTQKGYGDLLASFAEVRKTYPKARLAIAGQGPLHDELQGQIESMGLGEFAQLLGVRRDVPQLLSACDLFVSSSWWEGHPIAVLEAMAAGAPVVATSVGEVPHMIVDGTGIVVPPKEPQQLAQAMLDMLADDEKRRQYGEMARNHINANYSAEAWVNKLLELYKSVMKV
jgi:glycosyltransferase involved in cell wall biosynthesis